VPELPEVETVCIGLSALLPGKTVKSVWYDWPKSFPNAEVDVQKFLVGAKIVLVARRAKVLLIELSSKYSLVIHLKMTGQLVFVAEPQEKAQNANVETGEPRVRFGAGHPNDSLVGELPDTSTRVILDFGDSKLFFNDQRKFGWMRLIPTAEVPNIDFFKKIGPEPLADNFTAKDFAVRLRTRSNSSVKAALLDQTDIAGVGNIYADESLYAAKIHPETITKNISAAKTKKLFEELQAILKLSIEKGGSTDRNYVDANGQRGSYLTFAKVFRKDGQTCQKCGTIIRKIKVAGRGTHICPRCQKLRKL
jgi:formamidopyrimidine-DNA glycosylase